MYIILHNKASSPMSTYFTFAVLILLPLYWFYKFVNGTVLALLRRYTRLSKRGGTARTATVTDYKLRSGAGTDNEAITITFQFLNFVLLFGFALLIYLAISQQLINHLIFFFFILLLALASFQNLSI